MSEGSGAQQRACTTAAYALSKDVNALVGGNESLDSTSTSLATGGDVNWYNAARASAAALILSCGGGGRPGGRGRQQIGRGQVDGKPDSNDNGTTFEVNGRGKSV